MIIRFPPSFSKNSTRSYFKYSFFFVLLFPIENHDLFKFSTTFEERGEKERGGVGAEREGGRKFDLSAGMEEGGGQGAAEIAPLSRQIPTAFSFRFVLLLLVETYPSLPPPPSPGEED